MVKMLVDRIVAINLVILVVSITVITQLLWSYFRTWDAAVVLDGIEVEENLLKHSAEFDEPVVYQVRNAKNIIKRC